MIGIARQLARVLVAAVLIALSVPTATSPKEHTRDVASLFEALRIQRPVREAIAPPFTLADLDGAPVSLTDHRGRQVMLYFWTTW